MSKIAEEVSLATLTTLSQTHQDYNAQEFRDIKRLIVKQNGVIDANRRGVEDNRNAITGLRVWVPVVGGGTAVAAIIASAVVQLLTR